MLHVTPEDDRPPRHDVPRGGRSGFLLLDGHQVHYLEWGHAGLPAVVCLHGGGQTAYMYEDLGAALAGRYHVLARDFPDHGDSDPMEDSSELDRHVLAATVAPICAEFGIERATFVGGSMGGIASVTVASQHPELVEGLVLIDVGHRLEAEGVQRITQFMSEPESFASLEEAAEAIRAYMPNRAIVTGRLTRNLRQRADGRWVWKHGLGRRIRRQGGVDLTKAGERAGRVLAGLRDDLTGLGCPTLVVRGAVSDVLSEDGAEELMELIPDARLTSIAGAGHLAAGDNPKTFVETVSSFLDELTETRRSL